MSRALKGSKLYKMFKLFFFGAQIDCRICLICVICLQCTTLISILDEVHKKKNMALVFGIR